MGQKAPQVAALPRHGLPRIPFAGHNPGPETAPEQPSTIRFKR